MDEEGKGERMLARFVPNMYIFYKFENDKKKPRRLEGGDDKSVLVQQQ